MNNLNHLELLPLQEQPQASTIFFEEIATDFPMPNVNIGPEVAAQLVSGCIAISTILAISGLLKQFRLLIEALDREER